VVLSEALHLLKRNGEVHGDVFFMYDYSKLLAHHKIIRAVNNRNFEFVEIGRTNSIADK
jgi:hypothetical protein